MVRVPEVSVIIPAYNSADYIEESVESVLNQTFTGFEIIIIDDGSTDNTAEVLTRFSRDVTYVKQDNRGPSAARNKGISLSRGEYLSFLDSDDLFLPNHLEELITFLKEYIQVGFVFSDLELFALNGSVEKSLIKRWNEVFYNIPHQKIDNERRIFNCTLTPYLLKYASFIHTSTMTIRRDLLRGNLWFREGFHYGEDADFWARIAYNSWGGYIDKMLSRKRERTDSLIHNTSNLMRNTQHTLELSEIQRIYYKNDKEICQILDQKILELSAGLCWHLNNQGQSHEARALITKYIRKYPFSIRPYESLVKTFVPKRVKSLWQ